MKRSFLAQAALLVVVAVLAGPPASAHFGSFGGRYIAGSIHADPLADEAVGPVDCQGLFPTAELGGVLGGGCFDLRSFTTGPHVFVLFARDDVTAHVSLFAGFDADGDGCVGCVPGADPAWEGIDFVGGRVDLGGNGILAVFVRAVSHDGRAGVHLATTGSLFGAVGDTSSQDPGPCEGRGDPTGGQEGGCHRFRSDLPYPYPCLPSCTRP